MQQEFNALKGIFQLILFFIIFLSFGMYKKMLQAPLIFSLALFLVLVVSYRDFRLVINDNWICFYSIYRRKRKFYWSRIDKIEIMEEIYLRISKTQNMYIYSENERYLFNIYEIGRVDFIKALINQCANHNIPIINLANGKDKR